MTLLKDLTLADQKVPSRTFVNAYVVERPHYLHFNTTLPAQALPFLSPLSDCSLSPDFLMGEVPTFPQDFVIKTEPLDLDNYGQMPNANPMLANGTPLTSQMPDSTNGDLNHVNNNNPGDATPTENAMSLTELDQLLNPELTFYDELQISGVVKREPSIPMAKSEDRMDYDSDSADSDGSGVVCTGSFQEVESEIVRQVKNDIRQARSMLELPSDPKRWSSDNVQNWILWTLKQYNLGVVESIENFRMEGREFSAMTEHDFKVRSPSLGSAIYAQLDMWQNVSSLDDPTPTSSPSKPRLPAPNPAYMPLEQRRNFLQLSTSADNIPAPSSSDPVSPDPLSPTDSTVDNTSFGSSVSSCGSDDESDTSGRQTIHLWQFLKMLLLQPQFYGNCIRWLDRENGIFKIEDSQRVARLWGKRKNRPAMNYDKLSRSIRQYYKKGIIKKTENSKRLVYRFCHPYLL